MKKKILMLLVFCLTLIATIELCGGRRYQSYPSGTITKILNSDAFSVPLQEVNGDQTYYADYRMDPENRRYWGMLVNRAEGDCVEEFAYFNFYTGQDAENAKAGFQAYLEEQIERLGDSAPEEVAKLKKAVLRVRGSTLIFVVAENYLPVYWILR